MSGDHTRFTFDPRRRFAAVLMQQGRVQLDSDWNEQADLLRERSRLLGLDTGGPAWLPMLTTPNAFLIGALPGPPPDLSIAAGRIYVDGRLAEIFPGEPITYLNQPFWPEPPAFSPAVDTIVYLDLWEREVTWAEDTSLLDVALGGVDTTTRIQQIWQVKLIEQRGKPATCGVDLNALFPPSAGRLTTSAVAPPAPEDPCILPPIAGYRGIENRLYRVEIQRGGALGAALFKWSRDNGSIVSRVSAIQVAGGQSRVTVNRIGRDASLRFRIDDWVTLTDDHREFHEEAGQMARIVDIDQAARVIVLDRAVPTGGSRPFGPTAADLAARNTRLQRWDESAPLNAVDGDGLMTTAAGPIDLEDGVRVAFSVVPGGGLFHVGDYWVFAARTADASVEPLNQAPPRGIVHEYLQLAAIPAGGPPTDCRPKPVDHGAGCCTFVVRPGEDIQAAIDALPPAGGCVCLKSGLHPIDKPLVIHHDNVTLHGESLGAVVFNRRGDSVLVVVGGIDERVHTLTLRQGEAAGSPVVVVSEARELVIDDCRIETSARPDSVGLFATTAERLTISRCAFTPPALGVWLSIGCREISVTGCDFEMAPVGPNLQSTIAILARNMRGFLAAEGNVIRGALNGIIVNDALLGSPQSRARFSRLVGNRIDLVENLSARLSFGIDAACPETIVGDNQIVHSGGLVVGLRLCGSGSSASGNTVTSIAKTAGVAVAIGAGFAAGASFMPLLERVSIGENNLEGAQHGVLLVGATRSQITGNVMGDAAATFGLGVTLDHASDCQVRGNILTKPLGGVFAIGGARNRIAENRIDGGLFGVAVAEEAAPAIVGNRLTDPAQFGILAAAVTERCEISGNRLIRCGGAASIAAAIAVTLVLGELAVETNEIMDTGQPASPGGPAAAIAYGISGDYVLEARIESNLVTYSAGNPRAPANEDRAVRLRGMLEYDAAFGPGQGAFGFPVRIDDNTFLGAGATALVELREQALTAQIRVRFERVLFSGNYCMHFSLPGNDTGATVMLVGRLCTVSGNQVKATGDFHSYHFNGMPGPFIANVSHGSNLGRPAANAFPTPENAFNMIA